MVKKPSLPAASTASFSAWSAVRIARIGPGRGCSPARRNRLRSALLYGRSQAKPLPATRQSRRPWCFSSPSVTSGSAAATRATSSKVCTNSRYCPARAGSMDGRGFEILVRGC